MKSITGLLLLALFVPLHGIDKKCRCTPASSSETTREGANELVSYKAPAVYRRIEGIVRMPLDDLKEDVLVEVFDHPEYLLCDWQPNNPNKCSAQPSREQRRIAACKTGKDGKFCFGSLKPGAYELRITKDASWSPTHIYVVVDPRSPKSTRKPIEVWPKIGV